MRLLTAVVTVIALGVPGIAAASCAGHAGKVSQDTVQDKTLLPPGGTSS